jgi:cellulose synthase/poly-beta-1,6-N-acetylglucosamine synthase-like glycosyltransferase
LLAILYILVSILSLVYAWIMWRYIYHWEKLEVWETPTDYKPSTKISLIIPVRNEAENINACLQSIFRQNYPQQLMEVIVVDDHSTDQTPQILNQIKDKRLKILWLSDFVDVSEERAFKKKAITVAIDQATGDLIVTTDGDCIVPPRWLQRMAHFYETKGVKFIAAPVNFYKERNLLEHFQSLDFTGMMAITGAGIHGQFMNMCNGANLAYDKKAFQVVDGFSGINHLASGDDMLLMQKIAQRFPGKIGYLKNEAATVLTKAQETLSDFYNQRLRWASKSADYKEWKVTAMLGVVWLFCLSIVFSLIAVLFLGLSVLWLFFGQVLIKTAVDYALLRRTTRFFNRTDLMKYFLLSQVMHIFYIVSIGTLSIFIKKYNWKDRTTQ